MCILHYLEKSRSFRILWALEELQLDYQLHYYQRNSSFAAPSTLKQIHPLGKAPILEDQGQTLVESAVILEYLQETYDTSHVFQPLNSQAKQSYRYWMHYAEGSLMPLLVMQLVMTKVPNRTPWIIRPISRKVCEGVKRQFVHTRLSDHVEFLERYLTQHDYFAGRFSFVDIQMAYPLEALQTRTGRTYPAIQRFLDRISQRPAYFRAMSKEQVM